MKTLTSFAAAVATALIAGCVSPQEQIAAQKDLSEAEFAFSSAEPNRQFSCLTKAQCDKAWSFAKLYLQSAMDMRVQLSDEVMVVTYGPIEPGMVGGSLTRTPNAGESATIRLSATCKGIESIYFRVRCYRRLAVVYGGFRSFVETGASR